MYQPYFSITPKISSDLQAIGEVFGFFKAIKITKSYEKEYLTKVIVDTVNSSTAIEGNTLTNTQVKDVLAGKKIRAIEKDIQEVENYHRAVKEIIKIAKSNRVITENIVSYLHKIITHKLNIKDSGKYRSGAIIVGDYLPPKAKEVPQLMKEFVEWINNPIPKDLSPILYAAITHYRLVAIHPFVDGNGRTARLLTKLMLIKYGYNITKLFSLETYYNRDRPKYYSALSSVDKYRRDGKEDLIIWLEYFIEGFLVEAEKAKSRIIELQDRVKKQAIDLTDNQSKAINWFKRNKTLKIRDYIKITGLSRKGAYKNLVKLIISRRIKKIGKGRYTYYISYTDRNL